MAFPLNVDHSIPSLCLNSGIFSGTNCTDIDECMLNPLTCGPGVCINAPGTFNCDCQVGFEPHEIMKVCMGKKKKEKISSLCHEELIALPWPGFEPGFSRPQREVLTTILSRLNGELKIRVLNAGLMAYNNRWTIRHTMARPVELRTGIYFPIWAWVVFSAMIWDNNKSKR